MNARAISLTIVAFLLGALAAGGIGVRVIREVRTDPDATSLPQENIAPEPSRATRYQVDPNETLMASTALVPAAIEIDDGTVEISYDLISLAPQLGVVRGLDVDTRTPVDFAVVYPKTWVLRTTSGLVVGGQRNIASRTARFDVDPQLVVNDIESVLVTEAFAPFPIEIPFTLSETSPAVDVGFGVTAELVDVAVEGPETIVQIAITSDRDPSANLLLSATDNRWRSTSVNGEGGQLVTLRWADGTPPEEIRLRAAGSVMIPITGEFEVFLGGLS